MEEAPAFDEASELKGSAYKQSTEVVEYETAEIVEEELIWATIVMEVSYSCCDIMKLTFLHSFGLNTMTLWTIVTLEMGYPPMQSWAFTWQLSLLVLPS